MRLSARGPAMMILAAFYACSPARADVVVRSPNGRAVVAVAFSRTGLPHWSVSWRGKTVLDPAPIGLHFVGNTDPTLRLTDVTRRSHDEIVTGLLGKASTARDRYRERGTESAGASEGVRWTVPESGVQPVRRRLARAAGAVLAGRLLAGQPAACATAVAAVAACPGRAAWGGGRARSGRTTRRQAWRGPLSGGAGFWAAFGA